MAFDLLKQQIRLTEMLIKHQGTEVTLQRRAFVDDGMGGTAAGGLTPEDEPKRRYVGGVTYHHLGFEEMTTAGETRKATTVLVGMPDDDIRKDDEFQHKGSVWRVVSIGIDQTFEIRGECEWVSDAS